MIHSVSDLLLHAANKKPDKCAVLYKKEALTYAQIYEQSLNLAQTLNEIGVTRGDRVCVYLEKRLEKVISIFAISLVHAIFVPIRKLSLPNQAVYILENCEASLLITTSSSLSNLEGKLTRLSSVITVDPLKMSFSDCPIIAWNKAISTNSSNYKHLRSIATEIAAIMYTSGSTGQPKGVVLSNQNIIAGAKVVSNYQQMTENDRLLSLLTFGFDYGLNQLTLSFLTCSQLVLFNYLFPKDILKIVEKYRITGLAAVATTWIQLLQIPWEDSMCSLRYVSNTGGAIPAEFVKKIRNRIPKTKIYLMYGLTEAFRSTYLDPAMVDKRPGSIGKAVPGEEILIVDKNNRPVKPGETGELVHRGALVAQGYWKAPQLTAKRFRKNPLQISGLPIDEIVVYSGDYVRMDSEGYFYFEGRKDEMIKSAGNRISPTEIEETIYNSGLVADVVAFGIPHEIYGQSVCIVTSPVSGEHLTIEELILYCRNNIPSYMVPGRIEIWKELPRNTNGKLDRTIIKETISASSSNTQ